MSKIKCRQCEQRVDPSEVQHLSRFGGGTYRRPGRFYRAPLCNNCILDMAPGASNARGHSNMGSLHWDALSVMFAAQRIGWQGPWASWSGIRDGVRAKAALLRGED